MNTCSSKPLLWPQRRLLHCLAALPAITLLLLLLAAPAAHAALPFQQLAVDWSLVPDAPEAAANLSSSCICALLNSTCTPGCCCDPACPAELVQGFKAAGQCLPEGPPPQQLPYCIPAEPFAKVYYILLRVVCFGVAVGVTYSMCVLCVLLCDAASCHSITEASTTGCMAVSSRAAAAVVCQPSQDELATPSHTHHVMLWCRTQHTNRSTCQQGTTTACSSVQQTLTSSARCCASQPTTTPASAGRTQVCCVRVAGSWW